MSLDAAAPASLDVRSASESRIRLTAIFLMCGAILCFSGLDAGAKWLGRSLPVIEVVWARYAGAFFVALLFANPITVPNIHRTKRPFLQIVRSCFLLGSTACNFLALQTMQLAETTSIQFSMPLILALVAGPLLGEWVGPRRLIAIFVGFCGVLIMTKAGVAELKPGVIYTFGAVCCYVAYTVSTRMLAGVDRSTTTLFYSNLIGVLALTPLLPSVWRTPPTALHAGVMLLIGVFGAFGHWLLIVAHKRAPAAVLAPFMYVQIVWMTGLGFLVFGDLPGWNTLIGAIVVISSGLYLLYRERVRHAPPSASPTS